VQAHYQQARELALEESKQAHEIRTSYLDRLDKPGAKLRTLRFVLATTDDAALRAWASAEAKLVEADLAEIDRQLAALGVTSATLEVCSYLAPSTASGAQTTAAPAPVAFGGAAIVAADDNARRQLECLLRLRQDTALRAAPAAALH
jgi:hypothetical protein